MKTLGYKKIFIWLGIIIAFSNLPYVSQIIGVFVDEGYYRYSNSDGSSTFIEVNDRNYEMATRRHHSCNLVRPQDLDPTMYRIFKKNPLAFWRWGRYFYDERFKRPFKSWEEIKRNRKTIYGDGCSQSF